jgi:hypothetical protein
MIMMLVIDLCLEDLGLYRFRQCTLDESADASKNKRKVME